jgi:hypothetical protein
MYSKKVPNHKATATLTILWNERNARVFLNKSSPMTILLNIVKAEEKLWVAAGCKVLELYNIGRVAPFVCLVYFLIKTLLLIYWKDANLWP